MCVDYWALNKITVKNRYPLPRIDDLLDQLENYIYFTKLYLHNGYHQIRVAEQDAWKTAFKTKHGLFEWLVMPVGLCNAPTTFMHVMNDVFRPFLDDFVIVHLDKILVFSRTWDEHVRHVKKILDTLQREKLYVKLSKCEFGKTALVYLGHISSPLNLTPATCPLPKFKENLPRFLGNNTVTTNEHLVAFSNSCHNI
jgi:hypothetical protein